MTTDLFLKYGKTYSKKDIIFAEYEPGETFYLIQEGKVKVTKLVEGKEKILDIFGPGDIFGEMAIIEKKPRSATVEALTDLKVLEFNKENFTFLLTANPAWIEKLIRSFAKRIYEAKRRVKILLLKDPELRIMDTFCMLAECRNNVSKNYFDPISFKENMESIANWAGLDLDQTRKILKDFERMNRISFGNDEITVKNINEFYRIIESKIKVMQKMGEL
ncbi:MAG: Crp/Fnr family transcriptional regulator [Exilispira sp.]